MLKYYSVNPDSPRKEELNNQQYVGREVWIRGEIIEVADPVSGYITVSLETDADSDGEEIEVSTELFYSHDSDDLKFLNDEDQLIDD